MAGNLKTTAKTAFLELLFKNTAWAGIGDAGGIQPSTAAGSFWVALYSIAPTDSAEGTECNYTGYARVQVVRSGVGWTVATANNSNTAAITFGACSAGPQTAVAWAIHTASSGAGNQVVWGDLSPTYSITVPNAPEFAIGDLDINIT